MSKKLLASISSGFLAFALTATTFAADKSSPIAVFASQEYLGLDWSRTLLTYPLDLHGKTTDPAMLKLLDAAGREVPFQIWRLDDTKAGKSASISFFSELKKNSSYRYELVNGQAASSPNSPKHSNQGDFLVLDNGLVALRLPKTGDLKFDPPLPMGHDQDQMLAAYGQQAAKGIAPGPIQGIRLVDGAWAGGSYFWAVDPATAPKLTGYTCKVTEQGPLFIDAQVNYTFSNGGKYQMTARILADDPAIKIDEQFDMGGPLVWWDDKTMIRLMVSLGNGWQPDATYGMSPEGRISGKEQAFVAKVKSLGLSDNQACLSKALKFDQPSMKVFDVAVRYPWSQNAQFFGLVNTAAMTKESYETKKLPFLAVIPMHTGNWRGSNDDYDGTLFTSKAGDVYMNWRLIASPHHRELLHTGEYDPDLPLTFCRRQWALVGGSFQPFEQLLAFRGKEGFVTLDDYKDWVLDWPEDPKVTYPRLLFSKQDVEKLRPHLDKLPSADKLPNTEEPKKFLYFDDTDKARFKSLFDGLTSDNNSSSPYGEARFILREGDPSNMPWLTHYRLSQMAGWVGNMDEILSSGQLLSEQRKRLRRDLAALCYVLTEPDVNPRGSLTHLGNPNMPINRFLALPLSASLVPDHPRAKEWLDLSAKYVRYKMSINTAPGGAWSELMTYFQASAPSLMQTAAVLAQSGRLDESTARLVLMPAQFPARLFTPRDPRFGARIVPGWGHEGVDNLIHFLVAAAVAREVDPEVAKAMIWSWDQAGRPMGGHHDDWFSQRAVVYADLLNSIEPNYVPPQMNSSWLPGFGATMRAHAGDPNETYLSIRNGYLCSHSDANQGDFVLWAKGSPLVTLTLFQYGIDQGGPFDKLSKAFGWHNRPRFGDQQNMGGWPGGGVMGGIPAHAFNDSTDYIRAVGDYPDNRGVPQRWTRQIAMLKGKAAAGPNYFVFRDSFDAADGDAKHLAKKWWYLRTLGAKDQVKASDNELNVTSQYGAKLNVHFLEPATITAESRDAKQSGPLYYSNARAWLKAGSPVKAKEHEDNITVEETMTVTAIGPLPPGQDVLVVMYPQGKDEAPPKCETLGDAAARITTSEGVDYVFLNRTPMKFAAGDVTFEGMAGAVRVYPNEVHLIISEGPGSISYKGTTLRSPVPTVKVIPVAQLDKAQNFDIPASPSKLKNTTLPAGCRIEGNARCELNIEKDRIVGKSEGLGGFLFMPMPQGIKVLSVLVIDGQTYAPGTYGDTMIIPLLEGEHSFEIRAIEQPPIFRNWQMW